MFCLLQQFMDIFWKGFYRNPPNIEWGEGTLLLWVLANRFRLHLVAKPFEAVLAHKRVGYGPVVWWPVDLHSTDHFAMISSGFCPQGARQQTEEMWRASLLPFLRACAMWLRADTILFSTFQHCFHVGLNCAAALQRTGIWTVRPRRNMF